jgi:hypothetical protein
MRCAGFPSRSDLDGGRNHGGADMVQARTFVALDVHVSGTVAAIIDRDWGVLRRRRLGERSRCD